VTVLFKAKICQRRFRLRLHKTTAKHAVLFVCGMRILKEKDRKRLDSQQVGLLSSFSRYRYDEMAREQLG
jgi:hypothetical protein